MERKPYYITTPIYYPSDNPHIGHAYCSVAADTMARFKKLTGYDVYFLTGTDEHGQKIERKAIAKGVTPQQYVDDIAANFKALWAQMDVQYDDFIRTTDKRHADCVQKIFKRLYELGYIYKSEYEGWYCTPDESFFTELQLKDGMCPDCGRPVERMREESYFLKLSQFQDWLIEYIEAHPDFIQPASRAHEMIANFLKPGLSDLCVSRTSLKWGIPVDFDEKHTVYVWVDALSNYISALGYLTPDDSLFKKYWPADIHLVGKEIVRFHTIIWPIMLKMLGLPLPRQIFGHGWMVLDGVKISKSLGNVIDPVALCDRLGSDAIRYYLMREMPFGADGQYSYEALLTRVNADLANDLGNLVSRSVAMVEKYFDAAIPAPQAYEDVDSELVALCADTPARVEKAMNALQFSVALQEIWKLIGQCNRYIDRTQPWVLGRSEEGKSRLSTVLYVLCECVRFVAVLVSPVMPKLPPRIFEQLGLQNDELKTWDSLCFGRLLSGTRVRKGEALFPRVDIAKELAEHAKGEEPKKAEQAAEPAKKTAAAPAKAPEQPLPEGIISIDDFDKVNLRVARVTACEAVPKSDKLLKLTLSLGDETRTVVSGIAKWYTPEDMIGKRVVLLANLKPAKLRGVLSEGMILCASDASDEHLRVLTVDGDIEDGAGIR